MPEREAFFAGQYYPAKREQIVSQLKSFFSKLQKPKNKAKAIIAPHAGHAYSGATAAVSYSCLEKAKTFVIISPNHSGYGEAISIYPKGSWKTPLGEIEIDSELSEKIATETGVLDETGHLQEHSIEVQLPFLQYLFGDSFKIVAITIGTNDLKEIKVLGRAIAEASKGKSVSVIASGDFTHQEPLETAKRKDLRAIALIEKLDIEGFYSLVESERLSICGEMPFCATMEYCRAIGLKKGNLLKYDSSATTTGDESSVVGYAAIAFE